jgi:hypothetical protein
MIVLDENIAEADRELLKTWRIRARHIGFDIGHSGMKDENQIIPLLHSLAQPVLFSSDHGFYRFRLAHQKYSLVYLDVEEDAVASCIRQFLRHPLFNTKAKRLGKVARVTATEIRFWHVGENQERRIGWKANRR